MQTQFSKFLICALLFVHCQNSLLKKIPVVATIFLQTNSFPAGTLVVSVYVGCPDIKLTVTPDLKCPDGKGLLSVGFQPGLVDS